MRSTFAGAVGLITFAILQWFANSDAGPPANDGPGDGFLALLGIGGTFAALFAAYALYPRLRWRGRRARRRLSGKR